MGSRVTPSTACWAMGGSRFLQYTRYLQFLGSAYFTVICRNTSQRKRGKESYSFTVAVVSLHFLLLVQAADTFSYMTSLAGTDDQLSMLIDRLKFTGSFSLMASYGSSSNLIQCFL